MSKTKAITKVQPQALAKMEDWEVDLAEKTKNEVATEQMGVPRITHRGGVLKIDGQKVDGNKLPMAILTYGLMKTYYEKGFDPNEEGQTPDCYAFASAAPGEEAKMVPHEQSRNKQSLTCAGCPHNRFGTAEKGRGKRCGDKRRVLAVIGTDADDADNIVKAQVRQFEIPPGSLRNWGSYLKSLKEVTASGNVRAVLTELSAEPGDQGAHVLIFKAIGKLDKEQALALLEKGKGVETDLFAPFPNIQHDEKPKANAGAKSKVRGK